MNKTGRNDKCPGCGKKIKNCICKPKYLRIALVIIIFLIVILCIIFLLKSRESSNVKDFQKSFTAREDIKQGYKQENRGKMSPEEATNFYSQFLTPYYLRILSSYPVEDIREKFSEAIDNIGVGRKYGLYMEYNTREGSMASSSKSINTETGDTIPMLVIWTPNWKKYLESLINEYRGSHGDILNEKGKEIFEDEILLVVLHEYYHLDKQDYWKQDILSFEDLVNSESECWAYTCENIIEPMINNGRGPVKDGSVYKNFLKFKEFGSDKNDERWREYIADKYKKKKVIQY